MWTPRSLVETNKINLQAKTVFTNLWTTLAITKNYFTQTNKQLLTFSFNNGRSAVELFPYMLQQYKCRIITTYIFTRSPSLRVTSASLKRGEKWQTQLFTEIHVGKAIPGGTKEKSHQYYITIKHKTIKIPQKLLIICFKI